MLSCREVVAIATDYVEGILPAADRRRFEEHVTICPPCRGFLDQMRATRTAVGGVAAEPLPPALERALVEAFRHWKRS